MKQRNAFCSSLFHNSRIRRFLFFFFTDIILFSLSLYLSFIAYFEVSRNVDYATLMREVVSYFILFKLGTFALFRVYRSTWRYFGIVDLLHAIMALATAGVVLLILTLVPEAGLGDLWRRVLSPISGLPKSIIFMDFTISLVLLSFVRISKRFYLEALRRGRPAAQGKRTIIVGAGNTGEMILRDAARQGFPGFHPIGFLDDDEEKAGAYIHGMKVFGELGRLPEIIQRSAVQAIIIAIPSLSREKLNQIYTTARHLNVGTIKIVPRFYDFTKPQVNLKALEDISVEDLVGRQSVNVDTKEIGIFLRGKRVMITGAGGSIGSEIVVQVCGFEPKTVVLFDIDETELHNLGLRLARLFPEQQTAIRFVTGDVRDEARVNEVFEEYAPQIVFHAAAYKHVPMMEYNPGEAVKVNIFGTYAVAKASVLNHVEKFIMISSDKAVRPTSIMGATKRIAEGICKALNGKGVAGCELRVAGSENWAKQDVAGCRLQVAGEETVGGCGLRVAGQETTGSKAEMGSITEPAPVNGNGNGNGKSAHQPISHSTKFISVRFGNVLGSRGSVIPLFLDQLKHGGPLTVTHKDMQRYFMTIPEAVSLVLQAAVLGKGGEVLVLDMGKPAYIYEIAEQLVRMHGLEPHKDIHIEVTGLRPGEKLFEEILTAEEGTDASRHEKIFIAKNGKPWNDQEMQLILGDFREVLNVPYGERDPAIRALLRKRVSHYQTGESEETPARIEAACVMQV